MGRYFKVRNYEKFQHYGDRTPPWIKLYNSLLEDYEFSCLQDASKLHLILIWLLASRTNNRIPFDTEYLKQALKTKTNPDLDELLSSGFIEEIQVLRLSEHDASDVLSSSEQDARLDKKRVEEKRIEPPLPPQGGVFEQFWKSYPKKKSRGQAEKAWAALKPTEQLVVEILQGVERAKKSEDWRKDGGQFIPYPGSWLRAKGWLDEHPRTIIDPKTGIEKLNPVYRGDPQVVQESHASHDHRVGELVRQFAGQMKVMGRYSL